MKRFLVLLITAASCITASAQKSAPVAMPTGNLDGKTFKITLVAKPGNEVLSASGTATPSTDVAKDKSADMQESVKEEGKDQKPVENQAVMATTPTDNGVNNTSDYSMYAQPMASNKTTLSFNSGMLESPLETERKFEACPYSVNASEGSMTAFSAICHSVTPEATSVWSGMVSGSTIKGKLTYKLANGQVIEYSYTGTAVATKKTSAKNKTTSGVQTPAGKME